MGSAPKISDAEWYVMESLWDRHPATASEVTERLAERHGWSENTVKTMLGRLVKKRAVRFERDGKRYLYEPAVARDACVRDAARGFVERVFGGETSPMLAWLLRESRLDASELDALQELIEARRRGGRRR
ncbi:MAG: BlaI/MecI/CopY family transcriptional regulator [Planctomycetes bacterium]|nr:BlaI/MecI/CopY family transcriptional regulator [Planctomycetota bacterium]